MVLRGDQETSRALNRRAVVNHIRREGTLTRGRLVELTGLSGATVTFITSALLAEGFIIEDVASPNARVRPLTFNYGARFVVGLKLTQTEIHAVLTDLSTKVIAQLRQPVDTMVPEEIAGACAALFEDLVVTVGAARSSVTGIGLAMPGIIDAKSGNCIECGRFGWHYVPIGRLIAERVGVPVLVDNDVNAFALGEYLFGTGIQSQSLAAMTIGRGVGAGLIVNGAVFRGHRGGAGEIGHVPIGIDGRLCECGRYGCLEAYVSERSIVKQLVERSDDYRNITPEGVLELAGQGNFDALSVLDRAGGGLGRGMATLANLFDPEVLVLGGEGVRFIPYMRKAMQGEFERLAFGSKRLIAVHDWGDDVWARGAAGLVVQQLFNFEEPRGMAVVPIAIAEQPRGSELMELSHKPL